MSLANVVITNTFDEWRLTTNQLVTIANEIKEGAYVTSGNITITGSGTGLNVSSNVRVGGTLTVTGGLNIDTSTFSVDNQNNRVGIGTTTPSANLHVSGNTYISGNVTIGGRLTANSALSQDLNEQALIYALVFG